MFLVTAFARVMSVLVPRKIAEVFTQSRNGELGDLGNLVGQLDAICPGKDREYLLPNCLGQ